MRFDNNDILKTSFCNTALSIFCGVGSPLLQSEVLYMSKTCGIYKITSPSGGMYIGQSRNIEKRLTSYRNGLAKSQSRLHNSLAKYGFSSHIVEILQVCRPEELNFWEIWFVKVYATFQTSHGMNLTSGGGANFTISEETRAKWRRPQTPEHIENARIARTGLKRTPEIKEKYRQRMMGVKLRLGMRNDFAFVPVYVKDPEGVVLKFLSLTDCEVVVGISHGTLPRYIKRNILWKGYQFSRTPEFKTPDIPSVRSSFNAQPIWCKDEKGIVTRYTSILKCAEAINASDRGIRSATVKRALFKSQYYFSFDPNK